MNRQRQSGDLHPPHALCPCGNEFEIGVDEVSQIATPDFRPSLNIIYYYETIYDCYTQRCFTQPWSCHNNECRLTRVIGLVFKIVVTVIQAGMS